ncbi:ATP-binding protein [Desnuesiella massiliensis]|uniref:ATP-binding protein n=1 Tax=Desnuesiella massiliensis TaxID=1650662 RepID=UPI0006E43B61|nr:ATP-binding protein [Desnuesiella massiliensis]
MIKGYQSDIMKIYEKIREEEAETLSNRKKEVEDNAPHIIALERKIGKLCVDLSISAFKELENREEHLAKLKKEITELRIKKTEALVEAGYTIDYLNLHYRCAKCKDTGFIGIEKCICYKQKLVQLYYKNSDLSDILRANNFDNFNIEYYSTRKLGDEKETPRKNIEKILSLTLNFIKNFSNLEDNLLFYGNSGTGKTFLSNCIAKELLDKGHLVVYRTSEELIQNLKTLRFNTDDNLEDLLTNCDLLIIDDLGTEQINDFSKTELFNILNKRLLRKRKMLISTNLTLEQLSKTYSERITSRLFGNFQICKFYCEDIRVTKNLKRIR